MRIVGLDRGFNVGQRQRAVRLMAQRLRLHAAKHRRAATFPAIAMGLLANNVFITALAMAEHSAEVRLRAGGHKQGSLKAEHCGNLFLQGVDARIVAKHIVTQRRSSHCRAHRSGRLRDRVAAQIDHRFWHQAACSRKFFSIA